MPTDENESSPSAEPEPRCTSAPAVSLSDETKRLAPTALAWLEQKAQHAIAALDPAGELSVRIIADQEMAAAHQTYKNVPGTTDVLTFDLSGEGSPLDVDLLVCLDEAMRQAAARAHTPEQELLLYIVHGLLHCAGHDDTTEKQAQAMHKAEDELLAQLGVDATYARPSLQGEPK